HVEQVARRDVVGDGRAHLRGDEGRVVGQAARVLQQLTDGDLRSVDAVAVDEARQVLLDGGVEFDHALVDELHHDGRGEGLGVARNAHLARRRGFARGEVADAGRVVAGGAV